MKLISFFILFLPSLCFTQLSLSSEFISVCYWNQEQSIWDNCSVKSEYNSLFVVNKNETMFTHTTSEVKSTYYVKEPDYDNADADKGIYAYDVVSDVGNEYYFIFDLGIKEVKIVSTRGEPHEWYMNRIFIKSIF